jgi:hypothetical protein
MATMSDTCKHRQLIGDALVVALAPYDLVIERDALRCWLVSPTDGLATKLDVFFPLMRIALMFDKDYEKMMVCEDNGVQLVRAELSTHLSIEQNVLTCLTAMKDAADKGVKDAQNASNIVMDVVGEFLMVKAVTEAVRKCMKVIKQVRDPFSNTD